MSHSEPHPKSGQRFRIRLRGGAAMAIYDESLQGSLFELADWADRINDDSAITTREKEVAFMFFAHRCNPDLEPSDPVPVALLNLDDVVYGVRIIEDEERSSYELVLVREIELEPHTP